MNSPMQHFVGVIPAGGVGSRLWPLSRAQDPKFLHDVVGTGTTLLRGTWDRLTPLCGEQRILVVTGEAHGDKVRGQLPELPEQNIVLESEGRDSSAAIGLAAAIIVRRDPDAIIGSFAADHLIGSIERFNSAVNEAINAADSGLIVTIGIQPIEPSTAFGYIRTGNPLTLAGAPSARRVDSFVEKPTLARARRYLAVGEYLWNAGMFIARADALLEELAANEPELAAGIHEIADAWDTPKRDEVRARVWPTLKKIAIDYTVAEPAAARGKLAVIPGFFQWDDVGDFASVRRLAALNESTEEAGGTGGLSVLNRSTNEGSGEVVGIDASGLVVSGGKRVIAVSGLQNVVVIDTPDALLVTTTAAAQSVKDLTKLLQQQNLGEVL